ncbi:Ribonuclease P protein subunit p21 [Grifola frondosa]|uniref:Ribonuclease P protein subunit p21 n=1 Tax=Grifola frondosa TaxID=5627 RepID=A0A1C7M218_GRIFR|nr:Ribonuclease P protein subunit p21 [Grifola frondosa]
MAKKNKDQIPAVNLSSVANRDIIQRLNFLYQASTYLNFINPDPKASTSGLSAPPEQSGPGKKTKRQKREEKSKTRHPTTAADLSRSYVQSMRIIGQKTMVRMDPSIKRTLCKNCNTVLIPGTTSTVRIKPCPSHGHAVVYTCLACSTARRIIAPPVLDPDAPPEASTSAVPPPDAPPTKHDSGDAAAMNIDQPTSPSHGHITKKPLRGRRPKKPHIPRPLPLFQRKGHIIFRGNDILVEDDAAQ